MPTGLEELITDCLHALEQGGNEALERLLATRSDQAADARRALARLRAVGLLPPAPETLPTRLGDYVLVRKLGEGGMGIVYAAQRDGAGEREVALKVVRPELVHLRSSVERFRREIESVMRIRHSGVVEIFEVGERTGIPYYTMELVEGKTLAEVLATFRGRDPHTMDGSDFATAVGVPSGTTVDVFGGSWAEVSARVALKVARALEHVHGEGIVHRDVKPSNVLVSQTGRAMLIDFGLAWRRLRDPLTRPGAELGSLPYMSPEQLRGEEVDERADVYALGVTLYELLSLHPAFDESSDGALRRRILEGELRPLRGRRRALETELELVCLSATEPRRRHRYPSAAALAADLERALAGRTVHARRDRIHRGVRRFGWRHRRKLAGALVAANVLVLGIAGVRLVRARGTETALESLRATTVEVERTRAELLDAWRLHQLQKDGTPDGQDPEGRAAPLRDWLTSAEELVSRLPRHHAALSELVDVVSEEALVRRRLLTELVEELEALAASGGPIEVARAALADGHH